VDGNLAWAQIVAMVRGAGASKVYLASASPPVKYPNVYGVDMPSRKEFVANNLTEEEVGKVLGADALIYQSVEDLIAVGKLHNPSIKTFDASCFDGKYVTSGVDAEFLANLEAGGRGKRTFTLGKGADKPAAKAAPAVPEALAGKGFEKKKGEKEKTNGVAASL
jgi:hypothetical protein